jgi:hypothetical protein
VAAGCDSLAFIGFREAPAGLCAPRLALLRSPPRPGREGNIIGLPNIKARIARLKELEVGLAAELDAWGDRDSPLSPGKWRHYREGIEWAIAGLFDARELL